MLIHQQLGHFFIVKIGRKFHCVAHDPVSNKTWTINPTDGPIRIETGWTKEAVATVSKGRAKTSAVIYFYKAIRRYKATQRKHDQAAAAV